PCALSRRVAERRRTMGTPPAARAWLERLLAAPAATLLALVLFGLVNYLSARHYRRLDWTRHALFTLSPRSREVVRGLGAPIDAYVLLGSQEGQYTDVTELLARYAAESRLLRMHTIDPDTQSDRFRDLVRRLGLRAASRGGTVASEAAIAL